MSETGAAKKKPGWTKLAAALRQTSPPPTGFADAAYSGWQEALIWLFFVVTVLGSVFLLLAGGYRERLIAQLTSGSWLFAGGDEESSFYRLPPPPPRVVRPSVLNAQPFVIDMSESEIVDPFGTPVQPEEDKVFVPPARNEAFEAAFRVLTAESEAAQALVSGELEGVSFKSWNPVRQQASELLVELVGSLEPDGREQKYIWLVNVQTNVITPQSQAARDLEASYRE